MQYVQYVCSQFGVVGYDDQVDDDYGVVYDQVLCQQWLVWVDELWQYCEYEDYCFGIVGVDQEIMQYQG